MVIIISSSIIIIMYASTCVYIYIYTHIPAVPLPAHTEYATGFPKGSHAVSAFAGQFRTSRVGV